MSNVNLSNTLKVLSNLKNIDRIIGREAGKLQKDIIVNWSAGKSAGGTRSLKKLTDKYTRRKGSKKRDLNLKGNLHRSMQSRRVRKGVFSVGPDGENIKKLEGNVNIEPNVLFLGRKIKKKIRENVLKLLFRGTK